VGKTTTAINLAANLAALGERVLLVDIDPQANATSGLGVDRHSLALSAYDVLLDGAAVGEAVVTTAVAGLSILPGHINLAGAEVELAGAAERESRLREALAGISGYDRVLIDCPPSLGLLTLNGLVAARSLLVPIQCEYFALEGLSQLMYTVQLVQRGLNPGLRLGGIILTLFDARSALSSDVVEQVRDRYASETFSTIVPRQVRLSEAPSHGLPVRAYARGSKGDQAYWEVALELQRREPGFLDEQAGSGAAGVPAAPMGASGSTNGARANTAEALGSGPEAPVGAGIEH
jgi:chromosome partitioning protein